MTTQTAITKILNSEASAPLKMLKLQNLALRTFASSPNQKAVIAAYKNLQNQNQ